MFLGAPDFARSEKKHSHRFSIFCVFTQPRSQADMTRSNLRCPLYPQKRTFGSAILMSALCQNRP